MRLNHLYSITLLLFTNLLFSSPNWGPTGHRALGKIAEKHLTKKTKKAIDNILKGESLAFVSTYADEIKSDRNFRKFSAWHYVNFPFNTKYEDSDKSKHGDLVQGIDACIRILKSKDSKQEDRVFYLKMLIHLIGDLHQPLHVGRSEDKGGNTIQVQWFGKGTNLHRVWDEDMIEKWNMSYIELSSNAKKMCKDEIKAIEKGTYIDWIQESQKLAIGVYASAKSGDKLSYKYSYLHFGQVRTQLQKGGIRLAKILNEIFG